MLRYTRPPPPPDFEAAVQAHRVAVKQAIEAPPPPPPAPVPGRGRRRRPADAVAAIEFAAAWGDFKPHFARAQYGKCGYCESFVTGTQHGDVEHFWPKGEVWLLENPGQELEYESRVRGRKHRVIAKRGYWWKAYDWSNYLLSCLVCNQYWKISFFPVQEDPRRLPPEADLAETALLLNPFDGEDPGEHLRFNDLGQVEARPGSPYGAETIRTLGLDRESLRRLRHEKARRAYRLAGELAEATDPARIQEILSDFRELGREEYVHAGMVRIIFKELCGVDWSELEKITD